jgi:hypothetical protein
MNTKLQTNSVSIVIDNTLLQNRFKLTTKFCLTVLTVLLWGVLGFGQTVLFEEDFEGASGNQNTLNQAGGYLGWRNVGIQGTNNRWWVFNSTRSIIINGNYSMAISQNNPVNNGTRPRYNANSTAINIAQSPLIDATGYNYVTLDFNWICNGEVFFGSAFDYGRLYYSTDNGINWLPFANGGIYVGQINVQNEIGLDISEISNQEFHLGFAWFNDGSVGNNPPLIIDDIRVIGYENCPSVPTISNPNLAYINDVRFLGSMNDVENLNTGFSSTPPGYQNHTGLADKAVQADGEGINVFLQMNATSFIKAWIDWNDDGTFDNDDTTERIYNSGGFATVSTTFGFVIPPGTPAGDYRLRLRISPFTGGSSTFGPCGNIARGETEDYLITVIENCNARITSVADADRCGPGSVTLNATSNLGGASFNWYDSETGGSLLATTATGSFTTPSLTTTTTYYVTAQNGCETLVRVPVTATINPVSDVTFDPPTLEACGEENAITINASGDTEIVYLIDEDFENGTLGVFQNFNNNPNGEPFDTNTQWTNQTSAYVPTNTLVWFPAISSGFGSNNFAMSTSDVNPPGPTQNFLELSSAVDATNVTNLNLTFDMYYSIFADFVDVQVNDGSGWATVRTYNSSIGIGTRFAPQSIDLSAYDGSNNLSIRIRFMSGWGDGVAVDNIKLFGERPVIPTFTWTSLPAVDAFLDAAFTIPYVAGTPAETVYIRPSLAQLELSNFDISANITLSNGCSITESITITNNSKVWHGDLNNSVDWDAPNNWRPVGVPTEDNCIIITDYFDCLIPNNSGPIPPVLYEAEAKSLSIKSNANLVVLSNNNLTVTEAINMENNATFNIRSGANVVQIDDVPNTGAGSADMLRSTQIRRLDYVYWSTPVANFNVSQVSPNTSSSLIYEWIPTGPSIYGFWSTALGTMSPGKGYIIRGPNNFTNTVQEYTANFRGRLNNGLITQNISRGTYDGVDYAGAGNTMATAQDDNWNLLGNPYPSAIDAAAFTAANTNIDGTVYLWTHGTEISQTNADPFYGDFGYNYTVSDYLAYNTTGATPPGFNGYIGANQGFFVLMEDTGGTNQTVEFNNSMRVKNQNDQFFRNAEVLEKHRIWIDLLEPSESVSTALIGYVPGATNDKDRLYDAFSINNTSQTIYSIIQDQNMSIQGRALPFVDTDVVPLGVLIKQNGVHTIAVNQVDGLFAQDQDIFIEDLELGIIHNLKEAPYFFTPEITGRFNNRFLLRYTNQTLNIKDLQLNTISIYKVQNEINIVSPNQNIKSVSVYDILGRIIGNYQNIDNNNFKFNLDQSNGTYIVNTELDNGVVKTKKIIH